MSWKIWKGEEDRAREEFDKAISLRNQGKWKEAADHFNKAADLFAKANKERDGKISSTYSALYYAVADQTPESLIKCANAASSLDPSVTLKIPHEISAGDLAKEAEILGREKTLSTAASQVDKADEHVAKELEKLSTELFSLGRPEFILGSLFQSIENPASKANKLMGFASMIRARVSVMYDPMKAVEYLSQATGYFRSSAVGEQMVRQTEDITKKTSKVAKCWFCDRVIQGESFHFVYLEAEITPYIKSKYGDEHPPIYEGTNVVACVPCASSIENVADRIARAYYEKAMEAIRAVRQELWEALNNLAKRVRDLERVAHRH
jgi:tetratricopeptide (TPR) repeat protein